jgi:hypothetical protein
LWLPPTLNAEFRMAPFGSGLETTTSVSSPPRLNAEFASVRLDRCCTPKTRPQSGA